MVRNGGDGRKPQTKKSNPPSVSHMLESVLGCKWSIHVLCQVHRGVRRPGELVRTAPGLTHKVLSERLAKLVRFTVLEKKSFPEVPPRVEYSLTPFGRRFIKLIDEVDALQRDLGDKS